MQALWMLIPEEAFILVIVGAGFAVMLRLISFAGAMAIVGGICAIALLTPAMDSIVDLLPDWALILLMLWFALFFFKAIFGRRVAENVISNLLTHLLLFPLRLFYRMIGLGRKK